MRCAHSIAHTRCLTRICDCTALWNIHACHRIGWCYLSTGCQKIPLIFLFEVFLSPLHLVSSNFWDDFFPLKFLLWIVYYRTHLCCCCLFCNQSRVRLAKSSWKKTGINRHAHAHVLVANSLVQLKRLHISIFVARSHVRTRLVAHSQASSSFFF